MGLDTGGAAAALYRGDAYGEARFLASVSGELSPLQTAPPRSKRPEASLAAQPFTATHPQPLPLPRVFWPSTTLESQDWRAVRLQGDVARH